MHRITLHNNLETQQQLK